MKNKPVTKKKKPVARKEQRKKVNTNKKQDTVNPEKENAKAQKDEAVKSVESFSKDGLRRYEDLPILKEKDFLGCKIGIIVVYKNNNAPTGEVDIKVLEGELPLKKIGICKMKDTGKITLIECIDEDENIWKMSPSKGSVVRELKEHNAVMIDVK